MTKFTPRKNRPSQSFTLDKEVLEALRTWRKETAGNMSELVNRAIKNQLAVMGKPIEGLPVTYGGSEIKFNPITRTIKGQDIGTDDEDQG